MDAGCAAGFEVLHRYVEEEIEGVQPGGWHAGLEAHLRSCPACREDHRGLIEAAEAFGHSRPTGR